MTTKPDVFEVATRLRPGMPLPLGFAWSAARCGIKAGRPDLALLRCDPPAAAAGVFTNNRVRAASVVRNAALVPAHAVSAVVVNSGNANAMTGAEGERANLEMAQAVADELSVAAEGVLTASTGVIGVPLPVELIAHAVPALVAEASDDPTGFAKAILTTDTCTKVAALDLRLPGSERLVRIFGVAKGSGMIHPDMATTLAFVCTDAAIAPELLQRITRAAMGDTFNAISVDGDTSTNDTVLVLAGGASGATVEADADVAVFAAGVHAVLDSLAQQVVRDGEGATRVFEVEVTGAPDVATARTIARGVCRSSLVKCSVFAGKPDFGRVAMAVGQAALEHAIEVDPATMTIAAQGVTLYSPAGPALQMQTGDAARRLREPVVRWSVDLGRGGERFVARGCDLSYDYVRINADEATQVEVTAQGGVAKSGKLGAYSPRLKQQLLVEGLAYVRRFVGLKLLVHVAPSVGGAELPETLAKDLELCLDAGLRPLVIVPTEAMAERIHDRMRESGLFSSAVVPDAGRVSVLLDRGHLCVLVRTRPDPAAVVDLAIKVGVQKLVTLTDEPGLRDAHGFVQRLSPENFLLGMERGRFEPTNAETLVLAKHAATRGVPALHILDARVPHALVGELFTDDGIGSLVTRQVIV